MLKLPRFFWIKNQRERVQLYFYTLRLQYFIETHYNVSTRRTVLYHDTARSIAIFITAFQYLLLFDLQ